MKRLFDFCLALFALFVLLVPILLLALLVKLTSSGPVVYWSDRVGRYNKIFRMPKFRTMQKDTPELSTALLTEPQLFLTPIGSFLRKSSLDELPQLWSILMGDMSFVGPRPVIVAETNLIYWRRQLNVDTLLPGLTGWAQINGRDAVSLQDKVKLDVEYLKNQSFIFDIKIVFMTISKVLCRDGVRH